MLVPDGFKAIEASRVGDPITSRSEYDPEGALEVKVVEEVFRLFGKIAHLHADGKLIRTTLEHPFWVAGKGGPLSVAVFSVLRECGTTISGSHGLVSAERNFEGLGRRWCSALSEYREHGH
jgi:hypothetical protein